MPLRPPATGIVLLALFVLVVPLGAEELGFAEALGWTDVTATPPPLHVLWQHHFGQGLVRSPNNLGFRGEPPTHPQLLDWLADRLVRQSSTHDLSVRTLRPGGSQFIRPQGPVFPMLNSQLGVSTVRRSAMTSTVNGIVNPHQPSASIRGQSTEKVSP